MKGKNREKIPAEIVIAGGGGVPFNYGSRDMTKDFDGMASPSGEAKGTACHVAEPPHLP